ncbi:MAG: GNAT family N-acetyltransferase [Bacteroidia bacterium]|nr:GNAT family N-acetyltransferase [Bacteroidia bacterium]
MNEYRFERLNNYNLKDLIYLYKHSFNEITDIHFIEKKYATEAFGLKYTGYIAYSVNNSEPAAYYGVFPIKVKYQNKEYLAAQSGDTMTHPNHRGKGLFITLAKMTYDLSKQEGVSFVFGFPNENSYPGFVKKLDWNHYADINNYKIKTGALPLEKLAKKYSVFKPLHNRIIQKTLKPLITEEVFYNSMEKQGDYGFVIHDSNYRNYKTYYSNYILNLNGVKCWIKIDGRLWVGDIEFCNEKKFKETVNALLLLAKKIHCSTIHFSVFENSLYDKYLSEYAKPYYKNAVGCLNLNPLTNGELYAYQSSDFDTF